MSGRHSRRVPPAGPVRRPASAEQRPGRKGRRGRSLLDAWVLILGVVIVVFASVMLVKAAARPRLVTKASAASAKTGAPGKKARKSATAAQATAAFAHMKKYGVTLHFPAVADEMVAIGFHQAWNTKATEMIPAAKPYPRDKYAATKQALGAGASLKLFLMASRGRGSSEYSAADCAVKPGAIILSPVTGVVRLVKTYKLSGYGTDYQVEIEADGASPVRVVMIHIQDVTVKAGDRVEGGVTPIATVRHLTGIDNQVNRYLPVPADHTHIQINDVGYKLNEAS